MKFNWMREILTYMLYVLFMLGIRILLYSIIVYAQTFPFTCPDVETVQTLVGYLNAAVLIVILVIVLFVVLFNMLGTVSTVAMRLGEFFTERIRFVFELLLIYILFIWRLDTAIQPASSGSSNCATIDWKQLFSQGPIFFQLIGGLLELLGLQID